jgi:hypothetical protein
MMARALRRAVPMMARAPRLLPCLLLAATACVHPYEPPRPDQPHAVIKIRRSYDTTAGTHLSEGMNIDENYVFRETVPSRVAASPLTSSVLSHPVPGTFVVTSDFHHVETRLVTESYQESRTVYRMESYDCSSGFGTNKSHRTCMRNSPHTEYVTKYRTVMKPVQVSDGHCGRQLRFAPKANHVYLLQYTYQAPGVCKLSCFEQVAGADGAFQNRACPPAPPIQSDD